ncbi:hypothetical protein AMTR_s00029p00141480 [Amborella trichopoda]|uniref:Uncharacterized protein n=2 Tax=Amborella trichopoda TaxID=13333 RepID=W1PNZ6_AMBTC|nr:hypothetical protein AMTR_s00029p00141480 [Amborella trichopoda]
MAVLITQSPPIAQAATDFVLDLDGHPLRTDSQYYILPVLNQKITSGLTVATRNGSCPLNVALSTGISTGLPVTFSPVNAGDKVVRLSVDQNIQFEAITICIQSTVWRRSNFDQVTGIQFVITGGVTGNPGRATVSNWFTVERESEVVNNGRYKLVFCPGVCDICRINCGNLGVYEENGNKWLAQVDPALSLVFKKV